MSVTKEKVEELTKEFGKKENDTGSTETQIAVLTERIKNITSHLKNNKKDHSGRRGLVILVSKRRKLLNYLRRTNVKSYKSILEKLNIRK
ncbi:MAG: 30S ribosomal protein S15 [Thaumarchaeota archaeon]|nr:30S ribosomal protein S15 [Nitrososphaerota archaeon]